MESQTRTNAMFPTADADLGRPSTNPESGDFDFTAEPSPDLPSFATQAFDCDPKALFEAVPGMPVPGDRLRFSATPVIVSANFLKQLRALSVLLDTAFSAIVHHYFSDERIRAIYRLPPTLESVLRQADGRPYRVGLYRPDFVFDRHGQARICEIGARYPLNGWMLSLYSERAYAGSPLYRGFRRQPEQAAFLPTLLELHPPGSTLAMLHGREPGSEIFHLRDELCRRGVHFMQASPLDLRLEAGRLAVRDHVVDRCILEMDRSELTSIPGDVLQHLIDDGNYLNDVRTLVLIHDKRVLAVLCDSGIMADLLPAGDYQALRRYLIPSWVVVDEDTRESLLARPTNMIAKRNSGGRGVDAQIRSECSPSAWRNLVRRQGSQYMFQEYVDQAEFHDPESGQPIHLVGMQLCHGPVSHGAGVFRGSGESIINVHQGRGRLYPALMAA